MLRPAGKRYCHPDRPSRLREDVIVQQTFLRRAVHLLIGVNEDDWTLLAVQAHHAECHYLLWMTVHCSVHLLWMMVESNLRIDFSYRLVGEVSRVPPVQLGVHMK